MRFAIVLPAVVLAMLGFAVATPRDAPGPRAPFASLRAPSWDPTGHYRLMMSDRFNARHLNSRRWETGWFLGLHRHGASGPLNSSELACYRSANVVEPGDGYVHLILRHQPSRCGGKVHPYTGALIDTRPSVNYAGGSFEARIRLPAAKNGAAAGWPAWWLNGPNSVGWPRHGEIDVVEGLGGATAAHVHYRSRSGDHGPGWHGASPYVGWHTFGVSWNRRAGTATFYWDGRPIMHRAVMPAQYKEYLVLDYTMAAGDHVRSFPSTMLVDWVRVWRRG